MSYVATHPEDGQKWFVGRRQIPYGFGWLKEGQSPYRELPMRVVRLACREYWKNPDLPMTDFRRVVGRALFGDERDVESVEDAFKLVRVFAMERNWSTPPPLTTPGLVQARAEQGQLKPEQKASYRKTLEELKQMSAKYKDAQQPGQRELHRIANWVVKQWDGENRKLLHSDGDTK